MRGATEEEGAEPACHHHTAGDLPVWYTSSTEMHLPANRIGHLCHLFSPDSRLFQRAVIDSPSFDPWVEVGAELGN